MEEIADRRFLVKKVWSSSCVPTRGTTTWKRQWGKQEYFNPRAHEGHDGLQLVDLAVGAISIHVPTRGTTHILDLLEIVQSISIHVPTRGTTAAIAARID